MTGVAFVDTETTGLDPDRHEIWEVGLILPDGSEHEWQLPVDLSRADPIALNISRFHERRLAPPARNWQRFDHSKRKYYDETLIGGANQWPLDLFAPEFACLTRGLHLAGAVVSFDAERLWKLLRANGECPMWHYHLIDVEALVVGWVANRAAQYREAIAAGGLPSDWTVDVSLITPPWDSTELSVAVGVNPEDFDRHTALGDARWAKAVYEAVMGS